jgi:hypothetical protein
MNSTSNYEIEKKRYTVTRFFLGQKKISEIIEQLSRQEINKQSGHLPISTGKTCGIINVE